jgi:hypothetical protein
MVLFRVIFMGKWCFWGDFDTKMVFLGKKSWILGF